MSAEFGQDCFICRKHRGGTRVDKWPDAPQGGTKPMAELSQRLRERLTLET